METGNIAKPVVAAAPAALARIDQLAAAGAVKTQLAPEASVQQTGETPAVRFATSEGAGFRAAIDAAISDAVERNVEVDPKTRELVFQTISKDTGEVVRQFPDEAILRLRAYIRDMTEAEGTQDGVRKVEKIA